MSATSSCLMQGASSLGGARGRASSSRSVFGKTQTPSTFGTFVDGKNSPISGRGRSRRSRSVVMVVAAATSAAAARIVDAAFADAASGEWEGHRVYFDDAGEKMTIPERFVPPAFKEWGVELVDWQSQCAMKVTTGEGIYAKELRFLPTQGCEADASTVESADERTLAAADVFPAAAAGLAALFTTLHSQ
jgi:hypothetical protein